MRFIYRPIRVTYQGDGQFEIFNTTAFTNASQYELTFAWSDGTVSTLSPDVPPMRKAVLPLPVAGILVAISMLLTLIAGIIPSRSAAKKDPVVALRTE